MHNADLSEIFNAAIAAVQPQKLVADFLTSHKLFKGNYDHVYVAGAGKAAAAMAQSIEQILGENITEGVIAVKHGHGLALKHIQQIEAGHPLPDNNSVLAAEAMIRLFKKAKQNDLIVFLLSGGASSLITDLPEGMALEEYNAHIDKLLKGGVSIHELNAERKKLSAIKGGKLVEHANGATIISLIISDVPGDDIAVIGSGPTVNDAHDNVHNYIIGKNEIALNAAADRARQLGYQADIYPGFLTGDAEACAQKWIKRVGGVNDKNKRCYIAGGETTVTVKGAGLGGRNQHFALSAAKYLQGIENITLLAAGTDGTDGPTDANGAIINSNTWSAEAENYLVQYDSYHFFEKAGGQIRTGPTQTNVMDIVITLVN